jgi:hypothetical protein
MNKQSIHDIYKQHSIFTEEVKIAVIQQYSPITKQWKFLQYRCLLCDSPFKTTNRVEQHKAICKELNTIKKRRVIEMPIQVITVKGERMYRWGDSGKLYKDRADAEKQAAAAYASGYKEPKKDMKEKNQWQHNE